MTQIQQPPQYAPPQQYAPFPVGGFGYPPPAPPRRRTGLVVGSVAGAVVVAGGLGVGAFLLFGGSTLDDADAEGQISARVQEQTGVAPDAVDCPSGVDLAEGTTSTCSVTLQGQAFDYTVTQLDDEGNVEFSSDAVYVPVADVETLLAEAFAEESLEVEASCDAGDRTVLIAADGLSIPCTVVNAEDSTDSADVTALLDAAGTVTFE
ncbi:DUF4333 domain-containing protein [Blastococcus sp. TF02A-26]|uniref:DUF4333 domain-containing protein n=1 Tax=Blastococcus sp. TF02A-26 TaxID=2250577 RepID=UPI000DE87D70|nr:DUF4333 domain-containing protein [Blastococcus sp. TF02A-26]RBY86782.1 hypothetical protein DQ240_08195 [Blastococcus sp. TF02A-26]